MGFNQSGSLIYCLKKVPQLFTAWKSFDSTFEAVNRHSLIMGVCDA